MLTVAFLIHVRDLFRRAFVHREKGIFWGPNSMVANWKDVKDLYGHLRWLGLGQGRTLIVMPIGRSSIIGPYFGDDRYWLLWLCDVVRTLLRAFFSGLGAERGAGDSQRRRLAGNLINRDAAAKVFDPALIISWQTARSASVAKGISGTRSCTWNDLVEDAGRGKDAGNAGARMGSCTDEVEALDIFASIVRTEPRTLCQLGFESERGPLYGQQSIMKILRRKDARGHDLVGRSGQEFLGQTFLDRLTIWFRTGPQSIPLSRCGTGETRKRRRSRPVPATHRWRLDDTDRG